MPTRSAFRTKHPSLRDHSTALHRTFTIHFTDDSTVTSIHGRPLGVLATARLVHRDRSRTDRPMAERASRERVGSSDGLAQSPTIDILPLRKVPAAVRCQPSDA